MSRTLKVTGNDVKFAPFMLLPVSEEAKTYTKFSQISAREVITTDYTIIMSRTLKVTGNHVKFARFMLLPVSEEAKTRLPYFFRSMYHKTVIIRFESISVRAISLSLQLWLTTITSTLIILDISKTSSNNCLLLDEVEQTMLMC